MAHRAMVYVFASIFFKVCPCNAYTLCGTIFEVNDNLTTFNNRYLKLADLIPLRKVGIKIIFTVKNRFLIDGGIDGGTQCNGFFNNLFV